MMGFVDLDISALGLAFGDPWGSGCAARHVTVQTGRPSLAWDDGPSAPAGTQPLQETWVEQ